MTVAVYAATREYTNDMRHNNPKRRVSVSGILHYIGVSTSGYYAWIRHKPSPSETHRDQMKDKIQDIYQDSDQIYGAPKITVIMRRQGDFISERTTGKYMHEMGICARWVKHRTRTTIHSDFDLQLKNILDEQFNPSDPNQAWVSDITYIWTNDGFVYLTSVMDLFSRRILAWTLSTTLEAKYVAETIQKAIRERNGAKPRVFHNDRGCQYVSQEFLDATRGMLNSYSKKGYPWDNACIESFHALIKREWLNRFKIGNYEEAYRYVFEYINTFYNTIRIHSHCGYLSPNQYEKKYLDQMETAEQKMAG